MLLLAIKDYLLVFVAHHCCNISEASRSSVSSANKNPLSDWQSQQQSWVIEGAANPKGPSGMPRHTTPHSSFLDSAAGLECFCVCVCVGCITNKLFNIAHKTLSHSAMTEQKSCRQAEGEEKEREGKRASGGRGVECGCHNRSMSCTKVSKIKISSIFRGSKRERTIEAGIDRVD